MIDRLFKVAIAALGTIAASCSLLSQDCYQSRCLVIDAQDLGMAGSVDKASLDSLSKGVLTSAGFLVPAPWFPEVVRWGKSHPQESLGVQFDLNAEWASYRWRPVSDQPPDSGLRDQAGYLPNNAQYIAQHAKPEQVAAEFRAQVDAARRDGLSVSHLDSHGGLVLYVPWIFKEYWKTAQEVGVPAVLAKDWVRLRGRPTTNPNIYEIGGTDINLADVPFDRILQIRRGVSKETWLMAYEAMLTNLPPGIYLLQVHLGFNDDELRAMTVEHSDWGAQWRQNDYDAITSPEFHKFLQDQKFVLIGWKDIKKIMAERKSEETSSHP